MSSNVRGWESIANGDFSESPSGLLPRSRVGIRPAKEDPFDKR